jgi:hypothetical protein
MKTYNNLNGVYAYTILKIVRKVEIFNSHQYMWTPQIYNEYKQSYYLIWQNWIKRTSKSCFLHSMEKNENELLMYRRDQHYYVHDFK